MLKHLHLTVFAVLSFIMISLLPVNSLQAQCSPDMDPPVIANCPADIIISTTPGNCSETISWTPPTATDGCPGSVTLTSTHLPGATFGPGTTVVTYTATDANGNSATCSFNVTINDVENPVFYNCPNNVTVPAANNSCFRTVNWIPPSASENCGSLTITASHNPGQLFPVGVTTVTYNAVDGSGNTALCSFTITVQDLQPPVISNCPGDIVVNQIPGNCMSDPVFWSAPSATDNCGGVTMTASHTSGASFPVGINVVTYTATDASGMTSVCSFTVTVVDNEYPVITGCPSNITVSNDAGVCGANVNWTIPTATDNCTFTFTSSHNSGDLFPIGTTTVTYTAEDLYGNITTCAFDVTVNDTEPPVVTCPADITVTAGAGSCDANITIPLPVFDDNCGLASIENDFNNTADASGVYPMGTTAVTFTVIDNSGNSATCSFNVTVQDMQPPVITCPADITVSADPGSCNASVTIAIPTATDNCGTPTLTNNISGTADASGVYSIGTTTVTYTATDNAGNSSTCSFTITVNDTEVPVISCPADITVSMDPGSCSANLNIPNPSSSDNCGVASVVNSFNGTSDASGIYSAGTTTVVFTVTDNSGNTATCSFTVTVNDTEAPVFANCPSNINTCGASVATWTAPTATDNCSVTVTSSHTSGDVFPIGVTTVTYTATDASGNTAVCSFNVIRNNILTADAGTNKEICIGSSTAMGGAPTASGGDGNYTYTWTPATGLNDASAANPIANPAATTTYTVVVTDGAGCSASASVTVTTNPLPVADAGADQQACEGTPVSIGGGTSASGGTAPYTYTWLPATGLDNAAAGNPTATPSTTTNYTLFVSDSKGCNHSDVMTMNVSPVPAANAGTDAALCIGNSAAIGMGANAGDTYSWTPATGLSNANISNPVANPASTTVYTLTVVATNGCSRSDDISVVVNDRPVVDAGADQTMCKGEPATLGGTTTASGAVAPYTFNWSPVTGLDGANKANPLATPAATTTYTVTVSDANGCGASDEVTISINDLPVVNAVAPSPYCENAGVQVLTGTPANGTFSGNGVLGGNSFDPAMAGEGTHDIVYSYTNSNGCTNRDTIAVTVNDVPSINITPITPICMNSGNINLSVSTGGGYWTGTGITNTSTGTFNPITAGPGVHNVTYTIPNSNGCTASIATTVEVYSVPAQPSLASVAPMCSNNPALMLSGAPSGGLYSGPGVAANGEFNPSIAGAGQHMVHYTVTNGNGCSNTNSTAITVLGAPEFTINAVAPVCLYANPVQITATAPNGSWSGPGMNTNFTGVFHPQMAGVGTHAISYSVYNIHGCLTTETTNVTVLPAPNPTITSLDPVCLNGGPVALTAASSGGTFSGFGVNGNMFNPSVTGTGNFEVNYTVSGGGCISNASAIINVLEPNTIISNVVPASSNTINNGAINITVMGNYAPYTYQWSNGAITEDVSGLSAGVYYVAVTNSMGCTEIFNFTVPAGGSTGLPDADHVSLISLYPNPAKDQLNIEINAKDQKIQMEVYDMLGRKVYGLSDIIGSKYNHSISLEDYTPGQYLIVFNLNGERITKKFTVVK